MSPQPALSHRYLPTPIAFSPYTAVGHIHSTPNPSPSNINQNNNQHLPNSYYVSILILTSFHSHTQKTGVLLLPFYRWGNWGPTGWSNFLKVKQFVVKSQVSYSSLSCIFHALYGYLALYCIYGFGQNQSGLWASWGQGLPHLPLPVSASAT